MKLCLRVVSGLQIGDQTRLDPPGGVVGRNEGCALQLRDDSVSRAHVELRFQQDGWWVYQRSTRSSTLVDGVPAVSAPVALREHGVLQLGGVTLEYEHELDESVAELESPPTMINVRHQLPAIQHTLLPQMTPMRAPDPDPTEAPATLIIRRPPPPPPLEALATHVQRPVVAPLPPPVAAPPPADHLSGQRVTQLEKERDELRREREQLKSELARLTQDNNRLRESQAALTRHLDSAPKISAAANQIPPAASANPAINAEALRLLHPFAESLEQAAEVLKTGDAPAARALIREASFGLADLRDLFESS